MPYFQSNQDDTKIYYQIYQPSHFSLTLIFSHGWPMSSRMFEHMVLPLSDKYRCIVYDRRGFGKSDWRPASWTTFSNDLAQLIRLTCSTQFIGIGASMGCNELLSVVNEHQDISSICKGLVWLGPAMPAPIATELYPTAPSADIWNSIIQGLRSDRQAFIRTALPGVFARDLTATELMRFENICEQADSIAFEQCIRILISKDFTADLENFNLPALVIWGKLDQNIPLEAGGQAIKNLATHVELVVYEDAAHGMYLTHAEQCLADMEEFITKLNNVD